MLAWSSNVFAAKPKNKPTILTNDLKLKINTEK